MIAVPSDVPHFTSMVALLSGLGQGSVTLRRSVFLRSGYEKKPDHLIGGEMSHYDVAVVGLGFTGLVMAVCAAKAGFRVVGIDDSAERVREIVDVAPGCGRAATSELPLREALASGRLHIRQSEGDHSTAGIHVLCVPTSPGPGGDAELTPLSAAVDRLGPLLRANDLVLVQSTCPPGTVEQWLVPRLARQSGRIPGLEIGLAYSPVRFDPGVTGIGDARRIPRVVGGLSTRCTEHAARFLRQVVDRVVPVGGIATAEIVKVFENSFRLVNISLVNELAELCQRRGVDVREVLDAAATKPFGFLAHRPGPGVGGECIPAAADFLITAAERSGVPASIVAAAIEVNNAMPRRVLTRVAALLADHGLPPLSAGLVLVVGVTYKPDVPSVRGSVAIRLIELMHGNGPVGYVDPYVPSLELEDGTVLRAEDLESARAHIVLLVTRHRECDLVALARCHHPVIDCSTGWPRLVAGVTAGATA